MSKDANEPTKPLFDKELDLSNAGRGVWLVKVPKYVATRWEKAPGNIEVSGFFHKL
jgi:TFIIF, beta subunit N-terminus